MIQITSSKNALRALYSILLSFALVAISAPTSHGKGKPPKPGDGGDGGGGVAPTYTMEVLGNFGGSDPFSKACALNESGDVVGYAQSIDLLRHGGFLSYIGASGARLFLDLNDLVDDEHLLLVSAVDINDDFGSGVQFTGEIRIYAGDGSYESKGYRMDLAIDGDLVTGSNLLIFGGHQTQPQALNNSGDVVGVTVAPEGGGTAFRFTDQAGFEILGKFPGEFSTTPRDINDAGVIVGYAGAGSIDIAWRYTDAAGFEDLGALARNAGTATANGLNTAGAITGYTTSGKRSGNVIRQGFIHTDSDGMEGIGILEGDISSRADAINDYNVIVGYGSQAFVYHADFGIVGLESQVAGGASLRNAPDVNNIGQICGETRDGHAYLLTPID